MTSNTDQWSAQHDVDWDLDLDRQQLPPATTGEAISEWARNCGSDPHRIGEQWLLTDYDIFVRNPHYTGSAQPHPDEEDYPVDSVVAPAAGHAVDTGDRSQLVTPRPVPGQSSQPLDEPPF